MEINLDKGMRLDLTKQTNNSLTSIDVGVSWGKRQHKTIETVKIGGFMGFGAKEEVKEVITESPVDLDLSVVMYKDSNKIISTVYYGNKNENGIKHSGDDTIGGVKTSDNETISIDFSKLDANVTKLALVLVSYARIQFKHVNHAKLNVYNTAVSGRPVLVGTHVSTDTFGDSTSMVFCTFTKSESGAWSIKSICEPARADTLDEIRAEAVQYL